MARDSLNQISKTHILYKVSVGDEEDEADEAE